MYFLQCYSVCNGAALRSVWTGRSGRWIIAPFWGQLVITTLNTNWCYDSSLHRSSAASLTERVQLSIFKGGLCFGVYEYQLKWSHEGYLPTEALCVSKMSGPSLSPLKLNCAPNNRPAVAGWAARVLGRENCLHSDYISTPLQSACRQ